MSRKSLKVIQNGKSAPLEMLWFIYQENNHYLVDITLPDRVIQIVTGSLESAQDVIKSYREEREREIKK